MTDSQQIIQKLEDARMQMQQAMIIMDLNHLDTRTVKIAVNIIEMEINEREGNE